MMETPIQLDTQLKRKQPDVSDIFQSTKVGSFLLVAVESIGGINLIWEDRVEMTAFEELGFSVIFYKSISTSMTLVRFTEVAKEIYQRVLTNSLFFFRPNSDTCVFSGGGCIPLFVGTNTIVLPRKFFFKSVDRTYLVVVFVWPISMRMADLSLLHLSFFGVLI